jgi:hypothetical protein
LSRPAIAFPLGMQRCTLVAIVTAGGGVLNLTAECRSPEQQLTVMQGAGVFVSEMNALPLLVGKISGLGHVKGVSVVAGAASVFIAREPAGYPVMVATPMANRHTRIVIVFNAKVVA